MPELPDLEVFKDNIFNRLTSKRLTGLEVFNPYKMTTPQNVMAEALKGQELLSVNRVGKELFFTFTGGRVISAHLMLNGQISIVCDSDVAGIKFKIFWLKFENETVVFSDRGGLCTIKYMPVVNKVPDAFDAAFTPEYFLNLAKKKPKLNIKAFLIDQSVVKGIGNAYADEILWLARVSPRSQVDKVPIAVMEALYTAIGTVLRQAVASIKAISPNIISGEERSFLKVHNKMKKQTDTGFPILIERIASKITYFTEEQVIYL